jgi:molybdopterin converting factor small subunit
MMLVIYRRKVWYNDGMKVNVKLFASLRTFGPDEQVLELPDQTTIDEVVQLLKIPATIRLLRIVNGEHRPADHQLQDNDDLALFPPIAGG